jgi:hypothetical protein
MSGRVGCGRRRSRSPSYGGDALVSAATGLARQTIVNGRRELADGVVATTRIRRAGAGRPGMGETPRRRRGVGGPRRTGQPGRSARAAALEVQESRGVDRAL